MLVCTAMMGIYLLEVDTRSAGRNEERKLGKCLLPVAEAMSWLHGHTATQLQSCLSLFVIFVKAEQNI